MARNFEEDLKLLKYFDDRKSRAAERAATSPRGRLFLGLAGFELEAERAEIGSIATIQKIVEPPGEVELAAALREPGLFGAIARYSRAFTYELAVSQEVCTSDQQALSVAYWLIQAIRIRSLSEFLVPVASDHSWSTIAAVTDHSCNVSMLEDYPKGRRVAPPCTVTTADIGWVYDHLESFFELTKNEAFRLAVESLCGTSHQSSFRIVTANLWAGLESLFQTSTETTYRLSSYVAAALEPAGEDRHAMFRKIKSLYGERSRAVHGGRISDKDLKGHIVEVRQILSKLLCNFIEEGSLPTTADIEKKLFEG